jgi:xanthine dehydrogenase accessory factor
MKEIDLWKFIEEKLRANLSVMLMVVAESSKSSPGRAGFKMAVSSDGNLAGTVGGGIMEYRLLEECRNLIAKGNSISMVKKLYHNKTAPADKSGLICGGTETLILKSLNADKLTFLSSLINSYNEFKSGILKITPLDIMFDNSNINGNKILFNYNSENEWTYEENSGTPNIIYVIGGGHVGLAVSKVLSTQDFYIVTIDPRENVFTMLNNTYTNKKLFISYEEVGKHIIEGEKSYAVVVTSEHVTDLAALKSIIPRKLKYIGLMGSKVKIRSIFEKLIENGIEPELLKKIHTPIGIEIEAESPEEIGISIAAEIIKVKNSKKAGKENE